MLSTDTYRILQRWNQVFLKRTTEATEILLYKSNNHNINGLHIIIVKNIRLNISLTNRILQQYEPSFKKGRKKQNKTRNDYNSAKNEQAFKLVLTTFDNFSNGQARDLHTTNQSKKGRGLPAANQ